VKLERVRERIEALDWQDLELQLNDRGYALTPSLLRSRECAEIASFYEIDAHFRKSVNMARQGFGEGEYRYFAEPVPEPVATFRESFYVCLAPIANHWAVRLRLDDRYPDTMNAYRAVCERNGQMQPTPLMLDYHAHGYNSLHQDRYGELAFPLQVAGMLSRPGIDFQGGEFLLVEQRPRQQSRGEAVVLEQGQFIVFPNQLRPVEGSRGDYRVSVRHGVSRIRSGHRRTLGIIFHDAQK
jgi:hypothetical protein